jgi:hypothetical protein
MSESEATIQFEAYYEEFTCLFEQITSTTSATSIDNCRQEALFRQCHEILQQLAVEARSVDNSSLKRDLLQRVKQEKGRLTALEQEHEKQSLMTGAAAAAASGGGRAHLQKNEDTLARQNETLERARRTMQETEAVGMEVTHELGQNRAKIESTAGSVRELTSLTDQAGNLLKSMSKPWWRR